MYKPAAVRGESSIWAREEKLGHYLEIKGLKKKGKKKSETGDEF